MTVALDRKSLICQQAAPVITGIDFVQVVDPATQTELVVAFIVDPDTVIAPRPSGFMIDPAAIPFDAPTGFVSIVSTSGGETLAEVPVVQAHWETATLAGAQRTILRVHVSEAGDFSIYRLTIDDPLVDRFFNGVEFSFKQGCESGFDCKPRHGCCGDEWRDVEIDYLARDFSSYSAALLDFAARYYPDWRERIPADAAFMLMELLAALGDEFSYTQDRYAREAFLETATQRRSVQRLARLVDYVPDPGSNAFAWLSLDVQAGLSISLAAAGRIAVWAPIESQDPVPFEIGTGLDDATNYWVHGDWNAMPLHMPDPGMTCLPCGATEAYLQAGAGNASLPTPAQVPGALADPALFWIGRTMILRSSPADPAMPERVWVITLTEVERLNDPVLATNITRIAWAKEQALPFELAQDETVLLGNIVPAVAGETLVERFKRGFAASADPAIRALAETVEREGPLNDNTRDRSVAVLYGLAGSEKAGLGWAGSQTLETQRTPEIRLRQYAAFTNPLPPATEWTFVPTLLDGGPDQHLYTVDPGLWRRVVRFRSAMGEFVHADYATNEGYTIRFGSDEFGRMPDDDSLFEVTYRTHAGSRANVPPDSIVLLDPPDGGLSDPQLANVIAVTNPLDAKGGTEPETAETTRMRAPEAFRAFPLRAVRDEDYREILERLPWIQHAGATARWTGSWLTEFITADPIDSFELSEKREEELYNAADRVRQAGRDIATQQPRFVAIDLRITICVAPGSYGGQVREAVIAALSGETRPGERAFFHPDNFTFGAPLRRSALEAAIQAVPGVRGVEGICIRPRRVLDWRAFSEPEYAVAKNEIIRIQNDPRYPERGSIVVRQHAAGVAAECAA
jgi:hypothetical protein